MKSTFFLERSFGVRSVLNPRKTMGEGEVLLHRIPSLLSGKRGGLTGNVLAWAGRQKKRRAFQEGGPYSGKFYLTGEKKKNRTLPGLVLTKKGHKKKKKPKNRGFPHGPPVPALKVGKVACQQPYDKIRRV